MNRTKQTNAANTVKKVLLSIFIVAIFVLFFAESSYAAELQMPYGAGFYDTSEYLIGNIAVGIVLLESNGAIDASTEDWTAEEEANVVNEIRAGLEWWIARNPSAKLTFKYDIHYKVPTSYEPITR